MRELGLRAIYREMLHIAAREKPPTEFYRLACGIRCDLKRAEIATEPAIDPKTPLPLNEWWARYPGLQSYIGQ
jgi:hypothetical protein